MTYCISKGGTFGRLKRRYTSDLTNKEMVLIEWGPCCWLSPVNLEDVHLCYSCYESRARDEAMKWLEEQDKTND